MTSLREYCKLVIKVEIISEVSQNSMKFPSIRQPTTKKISCVQVSPPILGFSPKLFQIISNSKIDLSYFFQVMIRERNFFLLWSYEREECNPRPVTWFSYIPQT